MKTHSARKLVINFILLSGGEALSKIFAFFAFAYLARILGPNIYGDIEFALAVTLFFNLVVEGGLGLLGAREIAKDHESTIQLTFHIVIIRCALAACSYLLLLLFVFISNKSPLEKKLVIFYGLTLFGTPGLLQWVFQGLDRMHWVAISSVLRWSIFAGIILLFVKRPEQVWMVPITELIAIGFTVILNLGVFLYNFRTVWKDFDFSIIISLLKQAFPICLTQLMWGLKIYLPTVMLGLLIGGEQVGWFGAIHRIVIALHAFVWMYYFNIYPSISRCTQQTPDTLQKLVGKSLQVNCWAAVFITSTGILFASQLISIVYGPQYAEAAIGFKFLIWLLTFALISGHYMYILIAYNKQWLELISAICGALVSIILNVLLIPRFGFIGATWAVLGSEIFIWTLNYYFVRREVAHIPFVRHLIKPVITGLVMTTMILMVPNINFFVMGVFAMLLYGLGILILQPDIINDVRFLISGKR